MVVLQGDPIMLTTLYFVAILLYLIGYLVAQFRPDAGRIVRITGATLFVLTWLLGGLKVVV